MKKLPILILLFFFFKAYSQEKTKVFSIDFKNLHKKDIIILIEEKTNYTFFFLEEWLDNKRITKSFKNSKIRDILDEVFYESTINYYITKDAKIILTNGNLIRHSVYNNNLNNITPITVDKNNKVDKFIGKEETQKKESYVLTGLITSSKTKKPIEGITVFHRKKNIFTVTNKKGLYKLILPNGRNFIETSSMEYASNGKSIILYNNGSLNFKLEEKSEELNQITIYSSKKRNIRQTVSGITELKAENIKIIPQVLGERDLLKAVTSLPGVKSAGEGAEGVNVRGGKVDQNLFLLDGGALYNPTHFLGLFSAINPFTTDQLKLYKGNMPAEYGGRLSSVFDITSKDASVKKFKGEASVGPVTGNLSMETPIIKDKSGLLLGVRSTYSNWILKIIDNVRLQNSNISFHDFFAKYNHKIDKKNSLKATAYYSKDKFQIASDSVNSYSNKIATLNWEHVFNDKHKGNLILANSNYEFNIDYQGNSNTNFDLNYNLNESSIKLKLDYHLSKKHHFNYGIESKLYNISPGSISPKNDGSLITPIQIPRERGLENGFFISDEFTVNKKLSFNLGLRLSQFLALGSSSQRIYQENLPKNESTLIETIDYDNYKIFKTYHGLSYRFSGRYSINDKLSIKTSLNKSFQYIHRLSSNTTASPLDTWRLSDTNIKPQESTQVSLGLFKNITNSNLEISVEGYYKKYKNLIDYKTGADLVLNTTIETDVLQGPGKSYGIEFLINKKNGKLNGWLGYTYARSLIKLDSDFNEETVNNGEYFSTNYDKPHNIDFVLNYKLTKRYSLSANFTYQTGRPITYPVGKYIYQDEEYLTYSNRNEYRIPSYYRLDIGFNVEGNHKLNKIAHSFWNFSIYNLLGRNNPYSVFFQNNDGQINSYKSSIFSIPIPTITYNFKF